jgi:hypothetical protein
VTLTEYNLKLGILIDTCDLYLLAGTTYYIDAAGYPYSSSKGYLHRNILVGAKQVDHANRNKLDNRRLNLRESTQSQNMMNASLRSDNTSGYRGVRKMRDKWQAVINLKAGQHCIGTYKSKEQAALMYDTAAKKHFGEFANLNFNLSLT